jgi:D-serine deaminase-like pyridoxal phosphate-dependent protein
MSVLSIIRNLLPLAIAKAENLREAANGDAEFGDLADRATAAVVAAQLALDSEEPLARLIEAAKPFRRCGCKPLTSQVEALRDALAAFGA